MAVPARLSPTFKAGGCVPAIPPRKTAAAAPSREGKKALVTYHDPAVSKQLAQMKLDLDRESIQDIVAEGSMLVARVQWTGTQDGPFLGKPPTGNKLRFSTADFFRIENGKFAEHWDAVDSLPRAIALGLVPAPAPPSQPASPKSP